MVTLLLVELHNCNKLKLQNQNVNAPCLEYSLSENVLDKLYEWGTTTGRYSDAVRLELLKLFELLVSHSRHQLLVHEPFLRPLLKLLGSSQDEIYPPDVEKRLVILLNQLCVLLMQNVDLLDLFFFSTSQHQQHGKAKYVFFSLFLSHCVTNTFFLQFHYFFTSCSICASRGFDWTSSTRRSPSLYVIVSEKQQYW